ncbi:MAG: VOC family protein [Alphaproteobacteria bacterium]|nr:VOC family protein [Alphaproteobacteria bacterium]
MLAKNEKTIVMLWFDGAAEAAAAHYAKAVPGSRITSIERHGKDGPGPEGSVMVIEMEFAGRPLLLLNGGPGFKPNQSVSITIYADDQKEVDFLWEHMSAGGSTMACGWVKDRWGFCWQITPRRHWELMTQGTPEVKARVFQAMLKMTKFDIAAIEAAAKG